MDVNPKRDNTNPLWDDDNIQFPRLLAEISSCSLLDEVFEELEEMMDLTTDDLNELFDRACVAWDIIKDTTLAKREVDGFGFADKEE